MFLKRDYPCGVDFRTPQNRSHKGGIYFGRNLDYVAGSDSVTEKSKFRQKIMAAKPQTIEITGFSARI